jgi:hypothetical protein
MRTRNQSVPKFAAVTNTPGVTPGLPLGHPADATTVRVANGETSTTSGPFVGTNEAVGGYVVLEADDIDAAIEVASRIPAARLGGAIEVRPIGTYWNQLRASSPGPARERSLRAPMMSCLRQAERADPPSDRVRAARLDRRWCEAGE